MDGTNNDRVSSMPGAVSRLARLTRPACLRRRDEKGRQFNVTTRPLLLLSLFFSHHTSSSPTCGRPPSTRVFVPELPSTFSYPISLSCCLCLHHHVLLPRRYPPRAALNASITRRDVVRFLPPMLTVHSPHQPQIWRCDRVAGRDARLQVHAEARLAQSHPRR